METEKAVHSIGRTILWQRDIDLLKIMAGGATLDEAAGQVHLSPRTVRRRLESIRNRIGVATTIQAVVWAARWGYVSERSPYTDGEKAT